MKPQLYFKVVKQTRTRTDLVDLGLSFGQAQLVMMDMNKARTPAQVRAGTHYEIVPMGAKLERESTKYH